MERDRIVDAAADALRAQVADDGVTLVDRQPDHELVIGVPIHVGRQLGPVAQASFFEQAAIPLGVGAPLRSDLLDRLQLDAQRRRLDRVHAEVAADGVMFVLLCLPVIAQQAALRRESVVIGGQEAAVAEAAEVLGRERRPRAAEAMTAEHPAVESGADGLRGILDERHRETSADGLHGVDVERGAEQVHADHGLRVAAALQRLFEPLRIEVPVHGFDVDEHRGRAHAGDDAGGREERVGRQHDLIARPDAERHQRHQQRIGARRQRQRVLAAEVGLELAFEVLDFGAEDVLTAADDADDRRFDGGELSGVAGEIDQWDRHAALRIGHGSPCNKLPSRGGRACAVRSTGYQDVVRIPGLLSRRHRLAVAALAALVCSIPLAAQDVAAAAKPNVVFLHWNDFHGQFRPQLAFWKPRGGGDQRELPRIGGAAAMVTFVKRARAEAEQLGARVIATDAGDWFQGTIEGNETFGRLSVDLFARLGVDAVVVGNHEYDFGPDIVKLLCGAAKFPVLGANIVVAGSEPARTVDYVEPFHVVDAHGVRVAIVGLITEQTKGVSTGPWGAVDFEAESAALQRVLPAARAVSDVVVLLTHCGLETDRALAREFPEVALILGGHSHTGLGKPFKEGGTWIVQTHGKGSGIYRVEARADPATKTLALLRGELTELDLEQYPPDAETAAWIAAETADITARWDRVIGTLEIDLNDSRGARSTAAGNVVCDAFLEATGAQLAFTNKGGLRTRLQKGPLTPRMIYELLPFDNSLISMDLTGAQLREILATVVTGRRRMLEIGGGTYRYSMQDRKRVLGEIRVGDAVALDDQVYRVVTSSFLARGGDGLEGFAAGTNRTDHGLLLRDVLIAKAERDGKLVPDASNRILFDR